MNVYVHETLFTKSDFTVTRLFYKKEDAYKSACESILRIMKSYHCDDVSNGVAYHYYCEIQALIRYENYKDVIHWFSGWQRNHFDNDQEIIVDIYMAPIKGSKVSHLLSAIKALFI